MWETWGRDLHRVCAAVHIASALGVLIAGLVMGVNTGRVVTVVALRNVSALHEVSPPEVSLLTLIVLSGVVSGTAHAVLSTRPADIDETMSGVNPYRWIDYAISSPMMVVVIALISGVVDVWALWGMAAMQSLLMLVSGHIESSLLYDAAAFRLAGVMCLYYVITVWGPVFHAIAAQPDVPAFVGWIIATLFLLFSSFGVVFFISMRSTEVRKTRIELAYAILSIAAKLSLQWLLFGGTLSDKSQGMAVGIVLMIVVITSGVVGIVFGRA